MSHGEWIEKAEFYAIGALTEPEKKDFETHLGEGCRFCEDYLREMDEMLTLLPRSLSPLVPPAGMKVKLMEAIAAEETVVAAGVEAVRPRSFAWASLLNLVLGGAVIVLGWNLAAIERELGVVGEQVSRLETELTENAEIVDFLKVPTVQVIPLKGLEASPGASAKAFWDPVSRTGYLIASGLDQISEDQVYEFWAIADTPVRAGVFSVDPKGRAIMKFEPLPEGIDFQKFAVTLEPAGGVPQPSGAMYLLGNVSV